jgi:hypothetical protein
VIIKKPCNLRGFFYGAVKVKIDSSGGSSLTTLRP